jgi:hypothetical protein
MTVYRWAVKHLLELVGSGRTLATWATATSPLEIRTPAYTCSPPGTSPPVVGAPFVAVELCV